VSIDHGLASVHNWTKHVFR